LELLYAKIDATHEISKAAKYFDQDEWLGYFKKD
jgi:hypothetical protein